MAGDDVIDEWYTSKIVETALWVKIQENNVTSTWYSQAVSDQGTNQA